VIKINDMVVVGVLDLDFFGVVVAVVYSTEVRGEGEMGGGMFRVQIPPKQV